MKIYLLQNRKYYRQERTVYYLSQWNLSKFTLRYYQMYNILMFGLVHVNLNDLTVLIKTGEAYQYFWKFISSIL